MHTFCGNSGGNQKQSDDVANHSHLTMKYGRITVKRGCMNHRSVASILGTKGIKSVKSLRYRGYYNLLTNKRKLQTSKQQNRSTLWMTEICMFAYMHPSWSGLLLCLGQAQFEIRTTIILLFSVSAGDYDWYMSRAEPSTRSALFQWLLKRESIEFRMKPFKHFYSLR